MNFLINWIKVTGIIFTDLLNHWFDPYEEFTRPVEPKYEEPLDVKAQKFEADMKDFWVDGFMQYNLPVNSGDQCLWHGVYTAMAALRYSTLQNQLSLNQLCEAVPGLLKHQRFGMEVVPRLIRGYLADNVFEDNVSNDQATGHVLGIYFLWKYGDIYCREQAKVLINSLATEVMHNKYALINMDWEPTPHGRLINGYLTDPLNLTLCLAIFKVAAEIDYTYSVIWNQQYDRLVSRYRPLIPYANVRCLWWEKTHHAHRAAIHYSILCDLEKDHDLHRRLLSGLIRTWKMERKSANPWIYYLLRRQVLLDPAEIENVKKHLQEFTLEDKQYTVERINSDKTPTFKWGKYRRARQPLPRWKVGSQDFFWQRHLYSVDDWQGNPTGGIRHNGLDYLVAYYGLKSLRLI